MISEVVMPQMGADMKEGTILRWLKAEGDEVHRGESIAEIETDKANVEIEAFEHGVFRKVIAHEGDTVPVGTVIAVIASPDEDISRYERGGQAPERDGGARAGAEAAPAAGSPAAAPAPETSQPAPPTRATVQQPAEPLQTPPPGQQATTGQPAAAPRPTAEPPAPAPPPAAAPPAPAREATTEGPQPPHTGGRVRASPLARRLAEEVGIDLAQLKGTGPDGRIVKHDVEAAREARQAARPDGRVPSAGDAVQDLPLTRMRETIARRMQQSKQTAPHYYLTVDVDMTEAMRMRAQINEALDEAERVSVNDLILLATARALVKHPRFNAYYLEDHLQLHSQVNLGIAVALDDGLVVAAIMDCARKGLAQIAREARDVAERARRGSLSPEEYSASTFTVSNLGGFGVDVLVPIINPPQVAILGVGAVREQPVVREGEIVARQMVAIVLAADHRATDGAEGARLLATLRQYLETPGLMLA